MRIDSSRLLDAGAALTTFFPLSFFVYVAFLHGKPQATDWMNAFLAGGAMAGLHLALTNIRSRGRPMSRLILGANVYLMIGGAAVLTNQPAVLRALDSLRESGIFLCILAVGVVTTFCSGAGFIGAANRPDRSRVKRYSLSLLLLAALATAASFHFRGKLTLSAGVPLVTLAVANRLFKHRVRQA